MDLDIPAQRLPHLLQHHRTAIGPQVSDLRGNELEVGAGCPAGQLHHLVLIASVDLRRRAELQPHRVDFIQQGAHFIGTHVIAKLAPDAGRKGELAIREGAGTTPAAEQPLRVALLPTPLGVRQSRVDVRALVEHPDPHTRDI